MLKKNTKDINELSNSNNILGKGTTVNGNIVSFGNIRVEGKLIGDIKTRSKMVGGTTAHIEGNVTAQNAEIACHVTGTLEVSDLLVLKETAKIEGDIITNKLVVESGANFNGSCKMGVKIKEINIGQFEEKKQAYHS